MSRWTGLIVLVLVGVVACAQQRTPPPSPPQQSVAGIPSGMSLAKRLCGACHAVGEIDSPMADAPPFASLYQRYPAGCLEVVLSEGMLDPAHPNEEGPPRRHPRMPMAVLADDQRADLMAYLRGLDPRLTPVEPHCPKAPPAL
ncbi:cytochrome C [Caulobacter zeae]|uniref:Cytochrome C n=1 Tax=Caulobacter zeae TaxID=2055137 RepID=A0A2N5DRE6_9CAUL|nr:cytochrome c [Caulobacter zeae]PLR28623.1 cytochrome C [Caulobacter zeae]